MFASTVDFRLSLDFFDSGLYTCAAVARLTLALAKLSYLFTFRNSPLRSGTTYSYMAVYKQSFNTILPLKTKPL